MTDLKKLVRARIESIGVKAAAQLFGVSVGTASNWLTGKRPPSADAIQLVFDELDFSKKVEQKPDDLVMWKDKEVQILLPVYRTFNPHTHFTLFANYAQYGPSKIGLQVQTRTVIHESRNLLIHKAMKTDSKTFIMFDDDMIFPCGNEAIFNGTYRASVDSRRASMNTISRLMASGRERGIVGGLYFGRHHKGRAQCAKGFESDMENDKFHRMQYDGYVPDRWVATGAMKIERWVIEKMQAAIDSGAFPDCKPSNEGLWYGYFNPLKVGRGEDMSFCTRAKELGIQSYVDADLVCLHVGEENYNHVNTNNK